MGAITFDFTNGGGNPVLGLLRWVTTGSTGQCFSSNSLPCWGNRVDLSAAGFAEGAVNTTTVTDPIANASLPALTFGEAAINLTEAGVFPPGICNAFGSAFLKSRTAASFTAEVKDFVAPQPVNISNCGKIVIHKVTENGDASFGYATATGTITFNLFAPSAGASCSGTPAFTQTVNVARQRHLQHEQHVLHRQHARHLALAGQLQRRRQQRTDKLGVWTGELHDRQRLISRVRPGPTR